MTKKIKLGENVDKIEFPPNEIVEPGKGRVDIAGWGYTTVKEFFSLSNLSNIFVVSILKSFI